MITTSTLTDAYTVAIGDLCVVGARKGRIVTHALGSCVGVTVYDPELRIGGMLHFMLPSAAEGETGQVQPWAFASQGVPALFKAAYALGAEKRRLVVCAAGAADLTNAPNGLHIGARNKTILRKLLWKNDVALLAEELGGNLARTMELDLADGFVFVRTAGTRKQIWPTGGATT